MVANSVAALCNRWQYILTAIVTCGCARFLHVAQVLAIVGGRRALTLHRRLDAGAVKLCVLARPLCQLVWKAKSNQPR